VSTTALQFVNRVLRWCRLDDITGWPVGQTPGTPEALVALDVVNDCWREVLEGGRPFDFDIRNNGVLNTVAPLIATTGFSLFAGSTLANWAVPIGSFYSGPVAGQYLIKLQATTDPHMSNTAVNVVSVYQAVVGPQTFVYFTLDAPWIGAASFSSAPGNVLVNEYVLPSYVRGVLSMRHQQTPIQLRQLEKHQRFDGMLPIPQIYFSNFPWIGIVGNLTTSTNDNGAAAPTTPSVEGIGLLLFPAPAIQYRLDYDYVLRRTPLVNASDVLDAVPDSVVDVIVERSFGRACYTNIMNDAQLGAQILARNDMRLKNLRDSIRPAILRHAPMRSLDDANVGIRRDWGRIPPITGSIV
jgi:hypothetical protein